MLVKRDKIPVNWIWVIISFYNMPIDKRTKKLNIFNFLDRKFKQIILLRQIQIKPIQL